MTTVQQPLYTSEVLKPDYSIPVLPESMDARVITRKAVNLEAMDKYIFALQPSIPLDGSQISTFYVNADGSSMIDLSNTNVEFNFTITSASNCEIFQYGQFADQTISYINDQQVELRTRVGDVSTLQAKVAPKQHMSNGYYGVSGDGESLTEFLPNTSYKVSMPINFFTGAFGSKMAPLFGGVKSFRLDIKWQNPAQVFTSPVAPTANLTNIRLVAKMVRPDSVVRDALISEWMKNGKIQFLQTGWNTNIISLPPASAGSQQNLVLNHPVNRPKALFLVAKNASAITNTSIKNAFINAFEQAYWTINGSTVPNVPIQVNNSDELLYQLDRCFGKSNGLQTAYYGVNVKTLGTDSPSAKKNDASCIVSYDLEVLHNLSSSTVSLSGNSTNTTAVITRNFDNRNNSLECLSMVAYEYLVDVGIDGTVNKYQ